MFQDFFIGLVRIHILHHAKKEPIYGAWMMEELRQHGYKIGPGTLYPLLNSMEKRGFLDSHEEVVDSKMRRYYCTTPLGVDTLKDACAKIGVLVNEVLRDSNGGVKEGELGCLA
ncbi:MAG: helix-turn-helix transcriptional regulator [Candidatus Latescibacteria bacterium]|nr:helix-turn-helix transcriptional regulator [Candidatus Latescibacterota bacterium]